MPVATIPRLKMCKACSEVAISHDGYCVDHSSDPGRILNYTDRPNPTSKMANPFGVEIEAINTCPKNSLMKVAKFTCLDTSVSGDGGAEIKLCADVKKIGDLSADTAQRARLAGAKVNKKCGLHVHMSNPIDHRTYRDRPVFSSLSSGSLRQIFPYLKGMEEFMFSIVPNSRRDNEYCKAFVENDYYSLQDHHSWIARGERTPTLELRIHPGSLNPWKIKAWTDVCKNIQKIVHSVLAGEPSKEAIDAKEGRFLNTFAKNSLAYKYLDARVKADGKLTKFGFKNS